MATIKFDARLQVNVDDENVTDMLAAVCQLASNSASTIQESVGFATVIEVKSIGFDAEMSDGWMAKNKIAVSE